MSKEMEMQREQLEVRAVIYYDLVLLLHDFKQMVEDEIKASRRGWETDFWRRKEVKIHDLFATISCAPAPHTINPKED